MTGRRDFIRATAAAGALGVSEGSAKPARRRSRAKDQYIGVVSSITIGKTFPSAIDGIPTKVKDRVGYHTSDLLREIKKLDRDRACRVIITVGGNVVFDAANGYLTDPSQKHFISLLGANPIGKSAQFFGGVSLQSADSNQARISWLQQYKGFQSNEIVLFRNLLSSMRAKEEAGWNGRSGPVSAGNDANGENSPDSYDTDFGKITESKIAVIISADPHFQDTKDSLIKAANDWVRTSNTARYVCYPLQDYSNAEGRDQPVKAVLFGPSLSEAYGALKTMAINYLNGLGSQGILLLENEVTDIPS